MLSFQDLCVFRSQKPWRRSTKELRVVGVEQALSLSCNSTEREPVLRQPCITPLGFFIRVIVNENHINLEKTTFCVLSVILIYLWYRLFSKIYICECWEWVGVGGGEYGQIMRKNSALFLSEEYRWGSLL